VNKKKIKRNILLNPGPATTTDTVKYAQVVPDICPREKDFCEIVHSLTSELTKIVANNDEYYTILFGGSGTAAMEAIISSIVDNKKLLVINNGAYGKRICDIAKVYDLNYIEFCSPWDDEINFSKLEIFIRNHANEISHIAVVHHETTSGLLNDIGKIGEYCIKYNLKLIVDAISSYAAIPIDMKKMNITYLAASSNKNLQGMAGLSFVIANKTDLESTKSIKKRNYYLNLYSQYEYFQKEMQFRFTPPVQTIYALNQAVIETKKESIEKRYSRYSSMWEVLIKGIAELGLKHIIPEESHSKLITAIIEPVCNNYDFDDMHDYFYERGITIYPGKIGNMGTFRIANIGDITVKDIRYFLSLLEQYLTKIGFIN
jgi:2-aminoethylphosphonate-pyruvate transaminase